MTVLLYNYILLCSSLQQEVCKGYLNVDQIFACPSTLTMGSMKLCL